MSSSLYSNSTCSIKLDARLFLAYTFLVLLQVQYKSDCEALYGRVLDNSNVLSSVQGTCQRHTEEIWNRLYPEESYNFNLTCAFSENISEKLSGSEKYTKYDLISAVKRQSPFFYQVIEMMNNYFWKHS